MNRLLCRWTSGAALLMLFLGRFSTGAQSRNGGVGIQAVSLPSGPGSIAGLGDAFQTLPGTGTGSFSIPLALTAGTGGLSPQLSLTYEGGAGNGVLGIGWSMGPGFIQRRTDQGIPRYVDGPDGIDNDFDGVIDNPEEVDTFLEPSGEVLVPLLDTSDPTRTNYFARIEGSFIRYRRIGDYWEGVMPTGERLVFGQTSSARIFDPSQTNHVFKWLLEREIDTHGNALEYHYSSFPDDADGAQKYLTEIRYGPGPGSWDHFHFIAFSYEDRSDGFEDARGGFLVHTGKRLVRVDIGTQGPQLPGHESGDFNRDGVPDFLNRRYLLGYGTNTFRSLITSVNRVGADGITSFPPFTFQYTTADDAGVISAAGKAIGSINEPSSTFDRPSTELVDLNGDGLPDLLETPFGGGAHIGYINQGQQTGPFPGIAWAVGQPVFAGPDGSAQNSDLSESGVHLADMDGDGLADLVRVGLDSVHYYRNSPRFQPSTLGWSDRTEMAVQDFPPPAPFDNPEVTAVDINSDKRMDILRSAPAANGVLYQIWYNLRQQTYSLRQTVEVPNGILLGLPGVQIADMNGDGVVDIARVRPSAVEVLPGLGYGRFGETRVLTLPGDESLTSEQVARAQLQDIDGDGLADLVIQPAEQGVLWFWLNQGNDTLGSKRFITDLPASVGHVTTRWADMNGNGTVDLVLDDDATLPHLTIVDIGQLLGAVPRPNLLTQVNNGVGGTTQLEYRSSTEDMIRDGTDTLGNYQYPSPYPLPFSLDVLTRESVSDSFGNSQVTQFAYHDGYYDPIEKQFRGFSRTDETTLGDSTAPGLITRMTYDVGATELALAGHLLSSRSEQADGRVFSQTTNRWQTRTFGMGLNGVLSRFAVTTNSVMDILELGVGTPKRLETDYDYDFVGNVISTMEWGLVDNGERLAGNDERTTSTTYAYNTRDWLVRLPVQTTLSDATGTVISQVDHFYDDESFSGKNPGVVTFGDPTLTLEWYDVTSPTGYVRAQRTRYDSYGNPILSWDPLGDPDHPENGHFSEVAYDPDFHQFPVQTTQHIGGGHPDLVVTAEYDVGFGVVTSVTDPNGFTSTATYDTFARVLTERQPGDSEAFPSQVFQYVEAVPLPGGGLISYVESRRLDREPGSLTNLSTDAYYHISRRYVDGLGRTRLTKSEAEPDPASGLPRYVASGGVLFNAKGSMSANIEDFFSGTPDYEDITSGGWTGQFHLDGRLVSLDISQAPTTRYTYDAEDRVVRTTQPDGSFDSTVFQPLAVLSYDENATDPTSPYFGVHTTTFSDGLGREIQIDEVTKTTDDGYPLTGFATWSTTYTYRADGALLSITDSQGNVKSIQYDGLGRRTFTDDWDRGHVTVSYDDASNVIEGVDAKGQHIVYTYDGANRPLTRDYQDSQSSDFSYGLTNDVVFTYDVLPGPVDMGDGTTSQATNTLGRLVRVRDTEGDETTAYDSRGRPTWEVRRLPDLLNHQWVAYRTAMVYDPLDRVTRLTYPDNDFITFTYNDRTRLTGISGGPNGSILAGRTYTPSGQQESSTFGNGVITRHAYDARLRMTQMTAGQPTANDSVMAYQYLFDKASNIQEIADARPASVLPDGNPRRNTQRYGYDSLYRLIDYQRSTAVPGMPFRNDGEIQNRYDSIGNMLSQSSGIQQTNKGWSVTDLGAMSYGGNLGRANRKSSSPQTPGPHALTGMQRSGQSRGLQYDANGNMTRPSSNTAALLSWDFENRLVHYADESATGDYRYDYTGRRVSKVTSPTVAPRPPPSTTLYVSRLFEVRPNDEVVKYVFADGERIAQITGRLNATNRLQRMRLFPGWNLGSLTLDVPNVTGTLGDFVDGVRVWNTLTKTFDEVASDGSAPRGSVLWVHSKTANTIPIAGLDAEPASLPLQAGGDFLPVIGPAPLAVINALPVATPYWRFPGGTNLWIVYDGLSGLPDTHSPPLAPGSALYVSTSNALSLSASLQSSRIRYYHADHLGSQTVVTDETGSLVEESAFYPFGQLRNHFSSTAYSVPYAFGGKENDDESNLDYFEARYLAADIGRFITVDPQEHNYSPQELNGYSYVENQPVLIADPSGKKGTKRTSATAFGQDHSQTGTVDANSQTLTVVTELQSGGFSQTVKFKRRPSGTFQPYEHTSEADIKAQGTGGQQETKKRSELKLSQDIALGHTAGGYESGASGAIYTMLPQEAADNSGKHMQAEKKARKQTFDMGLELVTETKVISYKQSIMTFYSRDNSGNRHLLVSRSVPTQGFFILSSDLKEIAHYSGSGDHWPGNGATSISKGYAITQK